MRQRIFNRSINFILIATALFIIGCTQKSEDSEPLTSMSETMLQSIRAKLVNGAASQKPTIFGKSISVFSAGLSESEADKIIAFARERVANAGLTDSTSPDLLLVEILAGAEAGIATAGLSDDARIMGAIAALGEVSIEILNANTASLAGTKEVFISSIAETIFGNLGSVGLSADDIPAMSKIIMQSMVGNLDQAGLTNDQLDDAIKSISKGAIQGLDEIVLANFDVNDLDSTITEISFGAVSAVDSISGISASDLSVLSKAINEGLVLGLGDISMTGYSASVATTLVSSIAQGSTAGLEEVEMSGFSSSQYIDVIKEISSGITSGLTQIDSASFDLNTTTAIGYLAEGVSAGVAEIADASISTGQMETSINEGVSSGNTSGTIVIPSGGFDLDSSIATGTASVTPTTTTTTTTSTTTTTTLPAESVAPTVSSATFVCSNKSYSPTYGTNLTMDVTIPYATDNVTARENLVYEVRLAPSGSFASAAAAVSGAGITKTATMTAIQTSKTVSITLWDGASGVVAVTVKDEAGNRAIYTPDSADCNINNYGGASWSDVGNASEVEARLGHRMIVFNNEMLVVSGMDQSINMVPKVMSASLSDLGTFTEKSLTLPSGDSEYMKRALFGMAQLSGTLYVAGGLGWASQHHLDVIKSTDAATWTVATSSAPFLPRKSFELVAGNNKLFAIAGGHATSGGGVDTLYADVWSSTDGTSWSQVTANAGFSARYEHSSFYFKGCLWVIGGKSVSSGSYVDKYDVWKSCNDGVTWSEVKSTAPFTASARVVASEVEGFMCAFGGYSSGAYDKKLYCSYDGAVWFVYNTNSIGREEVEMTTNGSVFYLFGGTYSGYPNQFYKIQKLTD